MKDRDHAVGRKTSTDAETIAPNELERFARRREQRVIEKRRQPTTPRAHAPPPRAMGTRITADSTPAPMPTSPTATFPIPRSPQLSHELTMIQ